MRISNGNFLDEDGNEVNLVELLRTGKATPVVNNNGGHHMSAHSGWFTDENGTPVNIVALIDAAIDEEGGSDEPAIGGISINGGDVVTPDKNGIINLTISGDGSTVIDSELSKSSTNPVQNKVVTGEIEDLNGAVDSLNGSLGDLPSIMYGDSLVNYNLDYDGYIAYNGINTQAPSTTNLERYSEYIPVEPNTVYALDARMKSPDATANSFWVNTVIYNSAKEPIGSRTPIGGATGIDEHGYYYKTVLLTMPATAAYFRVTARTYGDAILTMYKKTSNIDVTRASLQKFKRDIDEKIAEAISDIDINNNTGYSVVYSPNAYDYVCKSICHRGYNYWPSDGYPENTMPAYRAAKTAGFYYAETDVRITSDGHFVLLHDASINRTARNSDGTAIENTVNIADITLETALTYDFGIIKGETYAGTKIPTLEEFLLYCKGACLHPYIEIKFPHDEDDVKRLVDVVNSYGMKDRVTYIAGSNDSLKTISEYNPTARLGQLVSNITDAGITNTTGLRSGHNEVFICSQSESNLTSERITNIVNSNIGVELWCFDTTVSGIIRRLTDYPIVTGIIHNISLAGKVFHDSTVGVENSGT